MRPESPCSAGPRSNEYFQAMQPLLFGAVVEGLKRGLAPAEFVNLCI